jgi:hypothetical protein
MSAVTDSNDKKAAQNSGRLTNSPTKPKGKGGRPSTYSKEIADRICEHIATGGYATDLKRFGLPHEVTVCDWQNKIPEFAQAYARARERRAEVFADQIIEIADTCEDPQKGRLQVEARKWVASKLLPRVYGENQRVEVQHTISETAARVLADLAQRQKERKRLEAQCIDVTPDPSPRQGVLTPAISTGCEDTARIAHGSGGQDEGPVEPPRGATTGGPPLQKQPSLSAKRRQKK